MFILGVALPDKARAFAARPGFSKVRIGYLFMQPNASAAAQIITEVSGEVVQQYPAATVGYVPDGFIDRMMKRAAELRLEFAVIQDYDRIFLPGDTIDARIGTAASLPGKALSAAYQRFSQGLHVVQFVAPIIQTWLTQLRGLGATPIQYVNNAFIVSTTPETASAISRLPFVQFVDQLHASIKPQGVLRTIGQIHDFYVILANVPEAQAALAELANLSRTVPESSSLGDAQLLVRVSLDGGDIDRVLAHPLVLGISHVPTAALSDERIGVSMTRNVDAASGAPTNPGRYKDWLAAICPFCTTLAQDGFYVGFADTGLDGGVGGAHHADLPLGRVRYGTDFVINDQVPPEGSPCSTSLPCADVNGHGTMTAGIVAGNPPSGSATDAGGFLFGTGVAPSGGVFFSKMDLGLDTTTSVKRAATDARITASPRVYIQNHSYNQYVNPQDYFDQTGKHCGTATTYDGDYSIQSSLFDRSVKDADQSGTLEPITLAVSSGNQFSGWGVTQCRPIQLTLPAATAKNVISVGAAENVRGPSEQWGCQSNALPGISADSYRNIMAGSRRGTRNPQWYKPDLMAPGSNVTSLRSSVWDNGNTNPLCQPTSASRQPWPFSSGNTYLAGSGTSFAAPAAAGAALLASRVYAEWLLPGCANTASCAAGAATPALLKAMLVMGARSMRGGQDQAVAPWWVKEHQYRYGDLVRPLVTNGHYYSATKVFDYSSSIEPAWNTASGSHTADNNPGQGGITGGEDWLEQGSTIIGPLPNNQQGFGRIDLEDVLSTYPARDYVNDALIANPNDVPWSRTYQVHDPALPVKVVLTWTDDASLPNEASGYTGVADPAHILVNDLDLTVEAGNPCSLRLLGNRTTVTVDARGEESLPDSTCLSVAHDTTNNVEWIKFFPSVNGVTQFTVRVSATQAMNQRFALVVYNGYDSSGLPPPAKPMNVVATGNATPGVNVSWTAVSSATGYEVRRRSSSSPFPILIAQPTSTSIADSSVSAGTGYVYSVRARNATGVSGDSTPDFAATISFTDDPIVSGVSSIKTAHVVELRSAINAIRAAVGLPAFAFSPEILSGLTISAAHLTDLRAALNEARAAVSLPPAAYTDPALTQGITAIKAAHVTELRNGVR